MIEKVFIVSSVPLTEPVVRNRLFPFFEVFLHRGCKVSCICPKSSYELSGLPEGVVLETVDIELVKTSNFIKRAFKEASDAKLLLKKAASLSDGVFLITIPSMFLAFLSPFYLSKKTAILDVRDLSWEYLSEASLVQRSAKRFFRLLFKCSVSFFKLVCATNETEVDFVKKINNRLEVVHVSNGIRLAQFNQLKNSKLSGDKRFTVSYIGNIGLAQNLETLVDAARQLPGLEFKIVGSGVEENKIRALVAQYGLENVQLTGRVSWEQVLCYYDSTHVLYAQLSEEFSGAMPSKLYEYLSTGKPVVYGGQGQAVETLNQFEGCHVVPPCEPAALADKLLELLARAEENKLSTKNKEVIKKNYIRENAAKLLAEKASQLSMGSDFK